MRWGQPWKWGALEKLPVALCLLPRGTHGKVGLEGGAPNFLLPLPWSTGGSPKRGLIPGTGGCISPSPPLTCFFPTSALIQDKAGQLETQLQSGLGCGREGLPKGLGDRSPQPADLVQKRRVPGGGLRATSGGPACERLEVTVEWALELSGLRVS